MPPITAPAVAISRGHRALTLATICGGAFLAFLDTTIVNVAFPAIHREFGGTSVSELSWVLDGYFIMLAALLVPAGGIADRLGHRRVFTAGITVFVVMSAACAAAPTWQALVSARVLQGVGAAYLFGVSAAVLAGLVALGLVRCHDTARRGSNNESASIH